MKTIPIKIGGCTMIGYMTNREFPIEGGNCFDLIDVDGTYHRVVNFGYENLKEWIKRSGQNDIMVRCIPKSDKLWEICDDRIPKTWYNKSYCTVCTPVRMLPLEQRKEYVKNRNFIKTKDGIVISSTTSNELKAGAIYAPYIPKIKIDPIFQTWR